MISVVSYGVSNLGSMLNMLRRIDVDAEVVSTREEVLAAERIILPGVGAFDQGMTALEERGLIEPLRTRARAGTPILGVCLGMQMLGRCSEEGIREGLDLLDARCARLVPPEGSRLKVPHMGWCELVPRRDHPLLEDLGPRARFYFVHSYHVVCADPADVLAAAAYGTDFTAVVQRDNIFGAQFHPEKSHRFGMAFLRNFSRI